MEGVVAFVAGELIDRAVGRREEHLAFPCLRVEARIVDLERIGEFFRARAREPFGYGCLFGQEDGLIVAVPAVPVARDDHQRVAFPVADAVAQPLLHRLRLVRLPEAHDAGVVHHLDIDHHVVGGLHDLVRVVVDIVQHGRAARTARADQTAVGRVHAFGAILVACGHDLRDAGLALFRDGHLAVRRIGDPG